MSCILISAGMFLWVYLVLEILKEAVTMEDLRASVKSLPKDLAAAYVPHP